MTTPTPNIAVMRGRPITMITKERLTRAKIITERHTRQPTLLQRTLKTYQRDVSYFSAPRSPLPVACGEKLLWDENPFS